MMIDTRRYNNLVFVWKQYGVVTVYDVSSAEKYDRLLAQIKSTVRLCGVPVDQTTRCISDVIDSFGGVGCHDVFEHGTEFAKLVQP